MSLIGLKPNGMLPMPESNPMWGAILGTKEILGRHHRGQDAFLLRVTCSSDIPTMSVDRRITLKYETENKNRQKDIFRNLTLLALYLDQSIKEGPRNIPYDYKRYLSQKYMDYACAPFIDRNKLENISLYYGKFKSEVVQVYLSLLGIELDQVKDFDVSQIKRIHNRTGDTCKLISYQIVKKPWIYK